MKILFYTKEPEYASIMGTKPLGEELTLLGHEVILSEPAYNTIPYGRFDWVRCHGGRSWDALKVADQIGAKCHIVGDGAAYWRIGFDTAKQWGYDKEPTAKEIRVWRGWYKSWMSAMYEADLCSLGNERHTRAIEEDLFGGKRLPNLVLEGWGVDARYASALPDFQKKNHMITISRIEKQKGVMDIARALSLCDVDSLPPWYILGGGRVEYKNEIISFCRKNNIKCYIGIAYNAQKWKMLKEAKIMLQSVNGLPQAEGLLCDTPVLSYDYKGVVNIFDDSIFWAKYKSPEDFSEKLSDLLNKIDSNDPSISEKVAYGKQRLLNGELVAKTQEQKAIIYIKLLADRLNGISVGRDLVANSDANSKASGAI